MTSSCETNVTEFDPTWSHDGRPITDFIGIELQALFSGSYRDDNEHEMTLFSLKNEEFTPEKLRAQIEEHIFEIVEEKFHSGWVYFRLYYKNTQRNWTGISGTSGINTSVICSLFGPDYFNSLVKKHNYGYMNQETDEYNE
jgi:hypothetical protein